MRNGEVRREARMLQAGDKVQCFDDTLWGIQEAWHTVGEMHHNHREGLVEFELREDEMLRYKMVCSPERQFLIVPVERHLKLVA